MPGGFKRRRALPSASRSPRGHEADEDELAQRFVRIDGDLLGVFAMIAVLLAFVDPDLWIGHEVGLQLSHDVVAEQRALQVAFG